MLLGQFKQCAHYDRPTTAGRTTDYSYVNFNYITNLYAELFSVHSSVQNVQFQMHICAVKLNEICRCQLRFMNSCMPKMHLSLDFESSPDPTGRTTVLP